MGLSRLAAILSFRSLDDALRIVLPVSATVLSRPPLLQVQVSPRMVGRLSVVSARLLLG